MKWIRRIAKMVLKDEECHPGNSLSLIFIDDAAIQDLNDRFLQKDRPTDVMAFPMEDEEDIWGEIYISTERAKEQAELYTVPFNEELARLIIHGVLHLSGYTDSEAGSSDIMKQKEDYYLEKLKRNGTL